MFTRAKSLDHWVSKKEDLYSVGDTSQLTRLMSLTRFSPSPDRQGVVDARDATQIKINWPSGDKAERPARHRFSEWDQARMFLHGIPPFRKLMIYKTYSVF